MALMSGPEEYFPAGGEHTWWSALTPAGIPSTNTATAFKDCDANMVKLAKLFGATGHFRRLTPQEAERKGPGDTVNGKNRHARTLAKF